MAEIDNRIFFLRRKISLRYKAFQNNDQKDFESFLNTSASLPGPTSFIQSMNNSLFFFFIYRELKNNQKIWNILRDFGSRYHPNDYFNFRFIMILGSKKLYIFRNKLVFDQFFYWYQISIINKIHNSYANNSIYSFLFELIWSFIIIIE